MAGLAKKNVLVTGGSGFIGSHLVKKLLEIGSHVLVPYRSINPNSYFNLNNLHNKVTLVQSDKKDFKRIMDIITKYEVDYIFHLAAQPIVTTAFYNPLETFETNIMGTINILEAARLYGKVTGIVVVSSDKAYGKIPRASEEDPLSGDHPYEVSKSASDLIARSYYYTYKLPVTVCRFGNVYGEGDLNFNRIIPGIIKSLILNEVLYIRSNGKFVRDYVYVQDVVDGIVLVQKNINKAKGHAFNLSSTENLSVLELVKKIEKIIGKKIKYKIISNAINEIPKQSISFRKIYNMFNWSPKHTLRKKTKDILSWYKDYFSKI